MFFHSFQESESGVKKKLEKASITLADCLACSGIFIVYREELLDRLLQTDLNAVMIIITGN